MSEEKIYYVYDRNTEEFIGHTMDTNMGVFGFHVKLPDQNKMKLMDYEKVFICKKDGTPLTEEETKVDE